MLQTPLPLEVLKACLPYLHVSITAHLTAYPAHPGATPQIPADEPSVKLALDTISSPHLSLNLPEQNIHNASIAFVRADLHLRHPERQLSRPAIFFAASAYLRPPPVAPSDPLDDYLPSGIPLSSNVLSPLLSTPPFAETNISLPASRLEKVIPLISSTDHDLRPVRATSQMLKVNSALLLRTSRTLFPDNVYLNIDMHVPPGSSTAITLDHVECHIHGLTVTPLSTTTLPMTMEPSDRMAFVFKSDGRAAAANAEFQIAATAKLEGGLIRRLRIGRTLLAPSAARVPTKERAKHWSVPKGAQRQSMTNDHNEHGVKGEVKISISGPAKVKMGAVFKIDLFVLNAGSRRRRLNILGPASKSSSNSSSGRPGQNRSSWVVDQPVPQHGKTVVGERKASMAPVIVDDKELFMQASGTRGAERRRSGTFAITGNHRAEVVTLDTEVRCGALGPGACQGVSIALQTLSVGVISIEGIVVVDLDSRETCLIGEGWESLCYDDHDIEQEEARA